jgi:hypothetical protein
MRWVDPGKVLGGDAEHVADDLQGQWAREAADEVHPPAVDGRIDEPAGGVLDRLAVRIDRAGRESSTERAAHHCVALAVE